MNVVVGNPGPELIVPKSSLIVPMLLFLAIIVAHATSLQAALANPPTPETTAAKLTNPSFTPAVNPIHLATTTAVAILKTAANVSPVSLGIHVRLLPFPV